MQSLDYIVLELRSILVDITNCWLAFYQHELWLFVEQGVDEFEAFKEFVLFKLRVTSNLKLESKADGLRSLFYKFQ